jgi:glutamine amidotransferase
LLNNIVVIDTNTGNQSSVFNALIRLGCNVKISNNHKDINDASHLILPGVGSFPNFMRNFNNLNLKSILFENILSKKKPILGICIGMQVLASFGNEFERTPGLNLIPGDVDKIDNKDLLLPHIGWNSVRIHKETAITKKISNNSDFYFVHSYYFLPENKNYVTGIVNYSHSIPCIVEKDNIIGVQFHPEKSQNAGLLLLKNFISL